MVNFSVFNELSLPFDNDIDIQKEFMEFFNILKTLNFKNLNKIRMEENFKNYEILEGVTFQQFFGKIKNITFQDRLRDFITSSITKIETPLIKDKEIEDNEEAIENEYFYNNQSTFGGLACCNIWNTIAISFNSNEQWNKNVILLQKNTISINIRHSSKIEHLNTHQDFFNELEKEKKLNITQGNFWQKREEFFPKKIIFCKEIKRQIKDIDKNIFQQAISILRDVENDNKLITHYNYSGESQSVKDDNELKKFRYFTINNEKVYFDNHITYSSHKIYFLEQDNRVYIGYIGKHLPTKKF